MEEWATARQGKVSARPAIQYRETAAKGETSLGDMPLTDLLSELHFDAGEPFVKL